MSIPSSEMLRASRPLLVALVALSALACSPASKEAAVATITAPVEVVQAGEVPELRVTTGTVRPATVSPLSTRVVGDVRRVLVSEGDRVRAGQVLLEIDDRDARAQSARASAGAREVDQAVAAADAAIAAAQANASLAEATFRRFAALRERGSVSAQEYEEVAARRTGAAAELERAHRGRDQAVAQRAAASAGVTSAETFLGYTLVRSPIDGVVAARFVDPGTQAAPGMPLMTVEDDAHLRVETTVDESLTVRTGDPVTVDAGGRRIPARVTQVAALDPGTRSALVKIELPPGAHLRGGTFVRVAFATGTRKALTVPPAAIARKGQLASVFVVGADGVARMRLVTLGEAIADRVEVLSGLDDGERIVTRSVEGLRDGVKVTSSIAALSQGGTDRSVCATTGTARGTDTPVCAPQPAATGTPSAGRDGRRWQAGRLPSLEARRFA